MVTPAERGLESPTVGRACTLVEAERDAAATQVEKSMDEEKSMEGGGCRPQPQSAPGESTVTPLLVGVLVAAAPRNRRAHLPRADQLHSSRGEGGTPMVAGRQDRDPCQRYARRRRLYAWMAARSQSAI